ncbi:MAG: CHASE domain-containing protein [Rhizobiales bacterium]|nr:CHASE domain-containing protein [Hyphomicrobiales bacterium]
MTNSPSPTRLLPPAIAIVFVVFASMSALGVHRYVASRTDAELNRSADAVANVLDSAIERSVSLIRAEKALVEMAIDVSQSQFDSFADKIEIERAYAGMQALGYAVWREAGAEAAIAREHELPRPVFPETRQAMRAAIVAIVPMNERNRNALAFDMYSDDIRRAAIDQAIATDEPSASAPVTLAQEITSDKQSGFLIYLPIRSDRNAVTGLAYAAFRARDLAETALAAAGAPAARMRLDDVTRGETTPLFAGALAGTAEGPSASAHLQVAGRLWRVAVAPEASESRRALLAAGAVALVLLATGGLLAMTFQQQARAVDAAAQLHAQQARALQQRETLLREMNHRIKNMIARIAAIARATLKTSSGLDDFDKRFSARIAALAAVQDLVAGERQNGARLRDIVRIELDQLFDDTDRAVVRGDEVALDEARARAMALVVHELATNAAKYGAARDGDGRLAVTWAREGGEIVFRWRETVAAALAAPGKSGFGSRLIEAMVRGELGGRLTRAFVADGLEVEIRFPAEPS